MAEKAITRRLKIYINGEEVDATISNLSKSLAKFRAQSNRAVEGSDDWKKYNKNVAELEEELKRARDAQKQFREASKLTEKQVSTTGVTVQEFSGHLASLSQSLRTGDLLGAQEGFNGLKSGIAGAAKAALAFIATPVGAFITTLVGIGAAAKAFFDYNTNIAESVKLTQQLTGFDGDRLQEFRASVQATASTFDKEFNEVLRSANALSKQMQISQEEALDLINQGFVRGADASGDFLKKLEEYPVQFRNAGFTAQDFIDIATQEVKGGIYDDKLLDTLKEADIALKEFTTATEDALINAFGADFTRSIKKGIATGEITTKEAINKIIAQADDMGLNFQQKQQLIADVFKGAGEDAGGFGEIVLQLNEAFNDQNKVLTEVEAANLRVVEATSEYEQALADLFDASQSGFPAMLSNLKAIGNEILTNILVGIKRTFTSLEQLKNQAAFEGQAKAAKDVADNITQFGTSAAEESKIMMDATLSNIQRLEKEIYKTHWWENKDALEESLAQQKAYFKELEAIVQGQSQIFVDPSQNFDFKKEEKETGGDTRTEEEKAADKLAEKERQKKAAERLRDHEKLLAAIQQLEENAVLAKMDLDEQEIEQIRQKYAKLLSEAAKGSDEEGRLLSLQQGEIDAKKLELERKFQEEKEKVRLEYDLLSNDEKKQKELTSLQGLLDLKLLSEEEYQIAKKGIEDNYRNLKEQEEFQRKEEAQAKIDEEFQSTLERDELNDTQRYQAELERLQAMLDEKLISYETYEARLQQLQTRRFQQQVQKTQSVLGAIDNMVQASKQAELNSIEEVVKKKGESEEEFLKRKEESEKKKKEINKKYALTELLITIGQTVANTALAIIRAFSDLGPIAGAIAAAFVGTTGAIQIAQAKKQYNTVKSYARGGDTGTGDLGFGSNSGGFIRGVVEEDEYVVPKFVRNMPGVPRVIQFLEAKRTGQTESFAEGGEVSGSTTASNTLETSNLKENTEVLRLLLQKLDNGIYLNFTLNDEINRRELAAKLDATLKESKGK